MLTQRMRFCAGAVLYAPERERIFGSFAKQTARRAESVAKRSRNLALAYSASLTVSYLVLVAHAASVGQ